MIEDVLLTPLKIIEMAEGDVMHSMKSGDAGESGFGEAYFSNIHFQHVKAWKRHREMTLNLTVPIGRVRFVIYDDREQSESPGAYQEIILGRNNYQRLTVPPMLWMGFRGESEETALILNVANIRHDPQEADRKSIDEIAYNWDLKT